MRLLGVGMPCSLVLLVAIFGGCGGEPETKAPSESTRVDPVPTVQPPAAPRIAPEDQPQRIMMQRIVIAFADATRGLESARPQEEAARLARSLVQRIRGGADVILLRDEFSDDRLPGAAEANGPYIFCNYGVAHRVRPDGIAELPRNSLFPTVGDVAFSLKVGEVGLADYDAKLCPHGYDILIRTQ